MRTLISVRYGLLPALIAALLAGGCEDPGTGALDPSGTPPFLEAASVTPDWIDLGTLPPGPSGVLVAVTATVRLTDRDAGGSVSPVVQVFAPGDDAPMASAGLRDDGVSPDVTRRDGIFSARLQFSVTEGDDGSYSVRFSATDELGLRSNTLDRPLVLKSPTPNSPPVLSALVAPDTVSLPTSGELPITLSVAAADSDGYADIREVYFRSLDSSSPSTRIFLWDDGDTSGASGDAVAQDGRFTRIIKLTSSNQRGTYRFAFQATDAAGDTSATLLHVMTVK